MPYNSLLFIIGVFFVFSSCRQEMVITSPDNENSIIENNTSISDLILDIATNDGSIDNIIDFANCFRVKLPVSVIANGREVEIRSNEDLDIIRAIFNESSVDTDVVELIYPITVVMTDYSEVILNDKSEFEELSKTCNGENEPDDDNECIDFLYPISFSVYNTITEQTNTIIINNDNELFKFVRDLTSDQVASLNFPVTLILSDDTQETINNLTELENLIESVKETCDEDDDFDYLDNDFNDTQNPSTPINLTASNITETSVDLSWEASVDNIGIDTYAIYIDGILTIATSNIALIINDLKANTQYVFTVIARDAAGNSSSSSNEVVITTLQSPDATAPTAPLNLTSSNTTQTTTDLTWEASTDDVAVTGYDIYRDGSLIGSTPNISFEVSNLIANTSYTFTVIARDAAGNSSVQSNQEVVNTLAPAGDTESPSIPINLIATNTSEAIVDLRWTPSNDNVGVIGYDIYMDGVFLVFTSDIVFSVENLAYETTYEFQVLAKDAEGNSSDLSNITSITTQSAPISAELSILVSCSDWTVEKLERNGDKDLEDNYEDFVFNFFSDGTISVFDEGNQETYNGTWSQIGTGNNTQLVINILGLPDFNLSWDIHSIHEHSDRRDIEFRKEPGNNKLKFRTPCTN